MLDPRSSPRPARWSVAKCQIIMLYAAAFSDRHLALEELEEIKALVERSPSTFELSADAKDSIWQEVSAAYHGGNWDAYVAAALASLPNDMDLYRSVYAHCSDIVHADRRILDAETRFLAKIAQAMKIPRGDRELIDNVMVLKNKH